MSHRLTLLTLFVLSGPIPAAEPAPRDYPFVPVPFTAVRVEGGFWEPRFRVNRTVTVWSDFRKCEETGRISNFARAGKLQPGPFQGTPFDDSDVFKVVEGAAYTLATDPDPKLDHYLDDLIVKIAAAQEPDGYLYTARTIDPKARADFHGPERWSRLEGSHELYNLGHLYEAAVAHHQATGKRSLLDVALKSANLLVHTFGPGEGQRKDPPGHQEVEIGLAKLYRVTGDRRYLDLAKFFLDRRGRAEGRRLRGAYQQDHRPVVEQAEAVGHAVRAAYMYSGMADVAALTGDAAYIQAIDRLWDDVAARKLYLTGGIGARRSGEAFGDAYELPNAEAYNETCAAIANALWNQRMFELHGDARYIDVLERVIYNGFLAGIGLSGDQFFYPNPLASDGRSKFNQGRLGRSPWFGCACCPVNVVRFIPSIAGYVYARHDRDLYVNLFIQGEASLKMGDNGLRLTQTTDFPWKGQVRLKLRPEREEEFAVRVRIPGWAQGRPIPSGLYRYLDPTPEAWTLTVNGRPAEARLEKGYAVLRRTWKDGDVVELNLPETVRRVVADDRVAADRGRVALERGPIVYCVEGADHHGRVSNLVLPDDAALTAEHRPGLLGGVTVLVGKGLARQRGDDGSATTEPAALTAIPYYAWAHRQLGEMAVWLPRDASLALAPAAPTLASSARASASHVWELDTVEALNDQVEPARSGDQSIPRFTWWDHTGTTEWVQYDLARPAKVRAVDIYWFDDTGEGRCRVPKSWRLLYRDGGAWKPVTDPAGGGVTKDAYNTLTFAPVVTDGLRLEVALQPGFSGGILEWKVR